MDLLNYHLSDVNWWSVIVAVLPSFVIGAVWYMPQVFGNYWMRASGLKKSELAKGSFARSLALAFVGNFVLVTALAVLMNALVFDSAMQGAGLGFLLGVAIGGSRLVHTAFEYRPLGLVAVNTLHDALFLTVAGMILGAF